MDSAGNYLLLKVCLLKIESTQERPSPCSEQGNLVYEMMKLLLIQAGSTNRWETACKNKGLLCRLHSHNLSWLTPFHKNYVTWWWHILGRQLNIWRRKKKLLTKPLLSFSQEFIRIQLKPSINSKHEKIQYRNKYFVKSIPGQEPQTK